MQDYFSFNGFIFSHCHSQICHITKSVIVPKVEKARLFSFLICSYFASFFHCFTVPPGGRLLLRRGSRSGRPHRPLPPRRQGRQGQGGPDEICNSVVNPTPIFYFFCGISAFFHSPTIPSCPAPKMPVAPPPPARWSEHAILARAFLSWAVNTVHVFFLYENEKKGNFSPHWKVAFPPLYAPKQLLPISRGPVNPLSRKVHPSAGERLGRSNNLPFLLKGKSTVNKEQQKNKPALCYTFSLKNQFCDLIMHRGGGGTLLGGVITPLRIRARRPNRKPPFLGQN